MDKKERKNLVKKLTEILIEEKKKTGSGENFGDRVYKESYVINSKWVSNSEYKQLVALRKFINENPNLTADEIRSIISSRGRNLTFLKECNMLVYDFVEQFKMMTTKYMALVIAQERRFNDSLKRRLP